MSTLHDETPSDQDLYGDVHVVTHGLPDEQHIDPDGWPDDRLTDDDVDAIWVAEMERRDREAAEAEYHEMQAQEFSLVELLERSIQIETAKRQAAQL